MVSKAERQSPDVAMVEKAEALLERQQGIIAPGIQEPAWGLEAINRYTQDADKVLGESQFI